MTTDAQQAERLVFEVDPARLAPGRWCHRAEKTLGEGDIYASYSGDRIGMDQPVRRPFEWRGFLWVCTSMSGRGGVQKAEAYRLVHPEGFRGEPTTYREKTLDGDAARADLSGFYHGITVKRAGQQLVMEGPPAMFIPGQTAQLNLFG